MRDYELVVLFPVAKALAAGGSANGKSKAEIKTITEVVGKLHGSVTDSQQWGVKPLAYPIKKQLEALYTLFHLSLPPDSVGQLDRALRVNDGILRHLLVHRQTAPPVAVTKKPEVKPVKVNKGAGTARKGKTGKNKKQGVKR